MGPEATSRPVHAPLRGARRRGEPCWATTRLFQFLHEEGLARRGRRLRRSSATLPRPTEPRGPTACLPLSTPLAGWPGSAACRCHTRWCIGRRSLELTRADRRSPGRVLRLSPLRLGGRTRAGRAGREQLGFDPVYTTQRGVDELRRAAAGPAGLPLNREIPGPEVLAEPARVRCARPAPASSRAAFGGRRSRRSQPPGRE